MRIFQLKQQQLSDLNEKPFKLEKEIQTLFEKNLFELTGYEFVKSEFAIQDQRIDTLAFDKETNAFVIIEYKRSHNYSVFDQGVAYLNTLLHYKADFILEYNEVFNQQIKRTQVDWSQSKVVFVSPAFNKTQKQAVDFKDINIELWEIKRFENDIVVINGISKSKNAPSIKLSTHNNSSLSHIAKEIKRYSEDEHLSDKSDEIVELYNDFKQQLFNLNPDLNIVPLKVYIAFKSNKKNIVDVAIQQQSLKLYLNIKQGKLEDPKSLAIDMSKKGHWGNGDYEITLKDDSNLEYIMSLIKQIL